jgi:uncharacterized Zn finger protein
MYIKECRGAEIAHFYSEKELLKTVGRSTFVKCKTCGNLHKIGSRNRVKE